MKKSEMNFKDSKSLASVRKVINEANEALNNKSRTIATSAIPETLAGALGAGVGGVASFSDYCVDFSVSECFFLSRLPQVCFQCLLRVSSFLSCFCTVA